MSIAVSFCLLLCFIYVLYTINTPPFQVELGSYSSPKYQSGRCRNEQFLVGKSLEVNKQKSPAIPDSGVDLRKYGRLKLCSHYTNKFSVQTVNRSG